MTKKKMLIGVGLAGLIYAAYRTWNMQQSIKFFQYSLSSLKISLKNPLQPQVLFGVQIFNPNRTGVPVNDFFGTIKNNGAIVASFQNTSPINLAGNETKVITVNARVNVLSVLSRILGGQKNPSFQIEGIIKTGFFDMPISKTVNLAQIGDVDGFKDTRLYKRIQDLRNRRMAITQPQGTSN